MRKKIWLSAIVIAATAGLITLKNIPVSSQGKIEFTKISTNTAIISPSPTYEGCGYMWAYHNDPVVSTNIDEAVRNINPAASANVQLFGEDCVYADGHSTFSTMETDFYIRLPVDDLSADKDFGAWIRQVMEVIIAMPEDDIPGSKGFVEFQLTKSEGEQIVFQVSIDKYQNLPPTITDTELFSTFYMPPLPATPHPTTPTPTP